MAQRMVPCPHCKSPLPEHASFCPYCAQSVRPRRSVKPPSHLWGKALRWGLGVCLALAAVAAVVVPRLPKTYDAYGEVLYTDADGTYQLLLSTVSDRFTPMPEIQEKAELYDRLAELNRQIRAERRKLALCRKTQNSLPRMEQEIDKAEARESEVRTNEHRRR